MDIDKLIPPQAVRRLPLSFGSLMDIDKLILTSRLAGMSRGFGSLMDIDKLILGPAGSGPQSVLVL